MVNDAARAILGIENGELRTVDALYSLEARDLEGRPLDTERRPLMRALRGEHFADYEVLSVRPDGTRRRVVSTGTSVRDADGKVGLAIVVFRDVTELRRLEQQRDEYLSLISHDLRNPLGSILMLVSTLKGVLAKKGTPQDREPRAARRAQYLEDEVDARGAHGGDGLRVARRRAAPRAMRSAGPRRRRRRPAGRRPRTADHVELDHASPCLVLADAGRLERVIENLLTNALKYSAENAPVTARVARNGSEVELEVIDRGIGIGPESVKMLFDRYYRTTEGRARASGLGLGLYIARLIVEAHGGRVDVSSELGKGSAFRVTLPSSGPSP